MKKPISEDIGQRIKRLRKSKKLTRPALAAAVGVSLTSISYWEGGKTNITADSLFKLAEVFRITAHELWFGFPEGDAHFATFKIINITKPEELRAQARIWLANLGEVITAMENVDDSQGELSRSPTTPTASPNRRKPPKRTKLDV